MGGPGFRLLDGLADARPQFIHAPGEVCIARFTFAHGGSEPVESAFADVEESGDRLAGERTAEKLDRQRHSHPPRLQHGMSGHAACHLFQGNAELLGNDPDHCIPSRIHRREEHLGMIEHLSSDLFKRRVVGRRHDSSKSRGPASTWILPAPEERITSAKMVKSMLRSHNS